MDVTVRTMRVGDIRQVVVAFTMMGWDKPASLYERYLEEQRLGDRHVLVAFCEEFAGYGTIVWNPGYAPFRDESIPEIQDLNVVEKYRCRGVASRLMDELEALAAERSLVVGIGVGLDAAYGQAQRLYVRRGYMPDGRGITYHDQPVPYGEPVCVDDDLVLRFTKSLKAGK